MNRFICGVISKLSKYVYLTMGNKSQKWQKSIDMEFQAMEQLVSTNIEEDIVCRFI